MMRSTWRVPRTHHMRWIIVGIVLFALLMAMIVAVLRMRLLNIGKAYSGLTDLEIADMTEFFKQHTVQDYGRFRLVEPTVVIEIASNGIQKSGCHASGYALRFPRIVRIRQDKRVSDGFGY